MLIQYNNELAEIDERMEKQQYEMQTLNEEKQLLEKEYKRIPNPVVSLYSYSLQIVNCSLQGRRGLGGYGPSQLCNGVPLRMLYIMPFKLSLGT